MSSLFRIFSNRFSTSGKSFSISLILNRIPLIKMALDFPFRKKFSERKKIIFTKLPIIYDRFEEPDNIS
ncbi:MAG: hypothetical protein C0417_07490 [Chlorobiaceae bacterium]|nr:hypothetical protein [Chlorobiaceae bacterium]